MTFKAIALALIGAAGLAHAAAAQAQYNEGPFASEQALVAYWQTQNFGQTEIFLDGRKVHQRTTGFAPVLTEMYFRCNNSTQDIRVRCGSYKDPHYDLTRLIDLFETNNNTVPAKPRDAYLDGTLYRDVASSTNGTGSYWKTCIGSPSRYYPSGIPFYLYQGAIPGFGPPPPVPQCPPR
ncbi:hypothetical protein [Lysobacter enzymogenes]|uniref:hypothetical protein n=1 Tax=Lysobacter enzymogenes TaxID=69 RepID=UPI001A969E67|nr:hypothetical protein [Lysobacter enzymogenes]QQP97444.1 hypothetical protein JHW38_05265 [Lysobacter enzymogenes]